MARALSLFRQWGLRSSSAALSEVQGLHELLPALPAAVQGFASSSATASECARRQATLLSPVSTCSPALQPALVATCSQQARSFSTAPMSSNLFAPEYALGLHNIRDNPGANKKAIRVGRGDSSRRGNYSGRGMKGQKARGGPHVLYDGGQLGLIKFPVTRERPPYEVLYNQLGLSRLVEYIQLGRLNHREVITMKDLQDGQCATDIKYGVLLYGQASLNFPIHIQVTACDDNTRQVIEAAGGSVTRVYYTADGLKALLNPSKFTRLGLPLPQLPTAWHPKHNGRFDAIGDIRPNKKLTQSVS